MQRSSLKTANGRLEYAITHRTRVTRRLHMELDEDGGLVVVAPRHWSKRHINSTLRQNAARVEQFLVRARQQQMEPLQYLDGEAHLYLGRPYPLRIERVDGRRPGVVFTGHDIFIEIGPGIQNDIAAALWGWYRKQALEVFAERLEEIKQRTPWARDRSVPLKLRKMRRTWGNCSFGGVIKLNTHLVKAGLPVIDSVIAHELCHLEEMNHSKRFYALLESLNPNWREDRNHLRLQGNRYLLS